MSEKVYFDSLFLRRLRRLIGKVFRLKEPEITYKEIEYWKQITNIDEETFQSYLIDLINSSKPFLLTRFGSGILRTAIDTRNSPNFKNIMRYLFHKIDILGIQIGTILNMEGGDGFYPVTKNHLLQYGRLILDIIPKIDILASIMTQERFFEKELQNKVICSFPALESFRYANPWSKALEGKRVLVIHPFVASIRYQYENNREKLFDNPNVLPKFELLTIRAVQPKNISSDPYDQFDTWFDAYNFMKNEIDKIDFDVALLGCGAYGMPLGAYIKEKGKQAIHIGGATQFLFGIKGKRGEETPEINKVMNEHWIRPLPQDYPDGYKSVEDGCYW